MIPKLDEADCKILEDIISTPTESGYEMYKLQQDYEHIQRAFIARVILPKEQYVIMEDKNRCVRFLEALEVILVKHSERDFDRYLAYAELICKQYGYGHILPEIKAMGDKVKANYFLSLDILPINTPVKNNDTSIINTPISWVDEVNWNMVAAIAGIISIIVGIFLTAFFTNH